ncbi:hypothetical protein [Nocardia tengchongensis]|uniref:hypothetical protein n=1 Tax=Nocardia tengchongensis TaxID=2055889 RepID=UPI00368371E4
MLPGECCGGLALVATCAAAGPAHADSANVDGPLDSCIQLALPGLVGPPMSIYTPPNPGGSLGPLAVAAGEVQARLPQHVDLRGERQGFNDQWAYALDGGNLYVTAAGGGEPWRQVWLPGCGISTCPARTKSSSAIPTTISAASPRRRT